MKEGERRINVAAWLRQALRARSRESLVRDHPVKPQDHEVEADVED